MFTLHVASQNSEPSREHVKASQGPVLSEAAPELQSGTEAASEPLREPETEAGSL